MKKKSSVVISIVSLLIIVFLTGGCFLNVMAPPPSPERMEEYRKLEDARAARINSLRQQYIGLSSE